jgi:5-methylcytosine-specific restriction protein A
MEFISKKQELIDNILTIEGYLRGDNKEEKEFAEDLVRTGKTICVYKLNGDNHFAASRFLGYKNNSMKSYLANEEKDGRDTNPVITKIVGNPFFTDKIEEKFITYTVSVGIEAHDYKRNYWRVKDERGKNLDIKL